MFDVLRDTWYSFRRTPPGVRFQQLYRRRRQSGGRWRSGLCLVAGGLLMAAGLVLLAAPGPGLLVLAIGGATLAQASPTAARVLDWSEVRVRRFVKRAALRWETAPTWVRLVLLLSAVGVSAGIGIGAYAWMTSG
jgi:hypothetical protein